MNRKSRAVQQCAPYDVDELNGVVAEMRHLFHKQDKREQVEAALKGLVSAGCQEELLLKGLYAYCGGDPKIAQEIKTDFRRHRERMIALSKQLLQDADEVKACEDLLRKDGLVMHFAPQTRQLMGTTASVIQRIADKLFSRIASGRVSGRDDNIRYLAEMVRNVTGRPHYKELADLVQATRDAYHKKTQPDRVANAESIRKLVKPSKKTARKK
jgi:hypothetical protein